MISNPSQATASMATQPSVPEVSAEGCAGERAFLNAELWHACAGPLVSLPAVRSRVVYFPQGHSEQVAASTQKEVDAQMPAYPNLPPQIICQLHDLILHADVETDEVYCQMTLQPLMLSDKESPFITTDIGSLSRQPSIFFCKTLTASDTSTHGGFSIPRRAAEKVFPPLDFAMQPPAQQLVAKDLHDTEWKFRHIYRGQPKRHLLTTGWSIFVSAKRLVAGDSVLFIRNEKGKLLLGIRRAIRPQTVMPSSFLSSNTMHIGVLAAAAHAANTGNRFTVFYNPRASPSEFVISLAKFDKAVCQSRISVGMRFRMLFETEESSVRRYMGTITSVSDLDPVLWPNSHWRSIKVGWDESAVGDRQRRVSLWEIEPLTTFLVYPPVTNWRLQHPLDMDFEGFRRPSTWLQFHNGNIGSTELVAQGVGINSWLGSYQPKMDHSFLGPIATYPSKQIDFQQPSQIMLPDCISQGQQSISPLQQQSQSLPVAIHQQQSQNLPEAMQQQQQFQNLPGTIHQQQLLQLPHHQPVLQSSQLLQQQAHQQQLVQLPHQPQTFRPPLEKQTCERLLEQTSLRQFPLPQKEPQQAHQQALQEVTQQFHQQLSQVADLQPSHQPNEKPYQMSNEQPSQKPDSPLCPPPSQHSQLSRQHKQPRLEQEQFLQQQQLPAQQPQQSRVSQQEQSMQQQKEFILHQSHRQELPQSHTVLQQQQPTHYHYHQHQESLQQPPPQLVYASNLQQHALNISPQSHNDHLQSFKKVQEPTQQILSQCQVSFMPSQEIFPSISAPLPVQHTRNNGFLVQQAQQSVSASQQQQQEHSKHHTPSQLQEQVSSREHVHHRQTASPFKVRGDLAHSGSQPQALPSNPVSTPQSVSTDSSSAVSSTGGHHSLQSFFSTFPADALSYQSGPMSSSQFLIQPASLVPSSEIHQDLSVRSSSATAAASQLSSILPAVTSDLESTCVSSDARNISMPNYSISVPPLLSNSFGENSQEHYLQSHMPGQIFIGCSSVADTVSSVDMVDPSIIEPAESRSYSCNTESEVQDANHLNYNSLAGIEIPFGSSMFGEPLGEPYFYQTFPPTRTYTKVHKSGCVGRSLDVSCFNNYDELRHELARMFGLEGQLENPSSGWQLIFVDKENDLLLLGDDPWVSFVNNVRSITILSPSEVVQLQDGIGLPSVSKQNSLVDCPTQQGPHNPGSIITSTYSLEY